MPYRKSVPTLEEMCLNTATTNFVTLQHELADQPSEIINMIYERMCRQFPDIDLPPEIFINSGTKSIRKIYNFGLSVDDLLDKIGAVCKNLLILELDFFWADLCSQSLTKLTLSPRLQHLFLDYIECTDQYVAAIGQNCPQLTKLTICDSSMDVDAGFRSLIGCTKLTSLDLSDSGLTIDVCLFLLDGLPLLKEFQTKLSWSEIIGALKRRSNPTSRTYVLEKTLHKVNREDLMFVDITFLNLRELFIDRIDVNLVSVLCSNNISVLQRLTSLRLYNIADDMSEFQLKTLLQQCANLEVLNVIDCAILTDNLLLDLAGSNGFKHLRLLRLYRCDSVSLVSIMRLVEMRSPLKELMWQQCANMGDSAYVSIKSYAKNHNLDLTVDLIPEWYP